MCLGRAENEALSGDNWKRIYEEIQIDGNPVTYVKHERLPWQSQGSDEDLSDD
jgi:hypothetical protein